VQLLRSSGRTVSEIARDLGVSEQTLRNWAKQTDVDEGRAHGLTSEEREELRRLRREVRVLREEQWEPVIQIALLDMAAAMGISRQREIAPVSGTERAQLRLRGSAGGPWTEALA
jgi:transposase-like protein